MTSTASTSTPLAEETVQPGQQSPTDKNLIEWVKSLGLTPAAQTAVPDEHQVHVEDQQGLEQPQRVTDFGQRTHDFEKEETALITGSQYDQVISGELESAWILHMTMRFQNFPGREKFFITYREKDTLWRRVTILIGGPNPPKDSLEEKVSNMKFQSHRSAEIYMAIRGSLSDIGFYDTVTRLKLETVGDKLYIHVTEDINEIPSYPSTEAIHDIPCRRVNEEGIRIDSHLSTFLWNVRVDGELLVFKELRDPGSANEFLDEIKILGQLQFPRHVIELYGVVVNPSGDTIKGLLMPNCGRGSLADMIHDNDHSLPWARRGKWARQIVCGLSEIHEAGFTHGSLSLSHVLIDDVDEIKLIHPGVRGRYEEGWLAPEFLPPIRNNDFHRVSGQEGVEWDLYQLGMLLWVLATQDDQPEKQKRPLRFGESSDVPFWYRYMVEACLNDRPSLRIPSAQLLSMFPSVVENFGDIDSDNGVINTLTEVEVDSESDMDDDVFDTASIASIETSITSASAFEPVTKQATAAFIDLLYTTIDFGGMARSALERDCITADRLRNGIRRLLKLLSRDLSLQLQNPGHRDVCNFLMSFSRGISANVMDKSGMPQATQQSRPSNKPAETARKTQRRLEKVVEIWDDESDDSDESDAKEPIRPFDITGLLDLVASSQAFQVFIASILDLVNPTLESRLRVLSQTVVGKESSDELQQVISELLYSRPLDISISGNIPVSWLDLAKQFIENYTGQEWDWSPSCNARNTLSNRHSRLSWTCICGETRSADIPRKFANSIIKIRQRTLQATPSRPGQPNNNKPSASPPHPGSTASQSNSGTSQAEKTAAARSKMSYTPAAKLPPTQTTNPAVVSMPQDERYVLFMVPTDRLQLSEIEAQGLCNEELFKRMREEYYRTKGWFRRWFGLMRFSHCEFYKFEAWTKNQYCERGRGIPPGEDQQYFYLPKPMDREPPISVHEFHDRFYQRVKFETCLAGKGACCTDHDAVERIPQKKDLGSVAAEGRPQFYGIVAREKKSALTMVVYVLISSVPGTIFFFLWLFKWGHGNLQDASVLLMLSFSLLGLLYASQLF